MKDKFYIHDIQSYTLFANIDDRKGKINGHMMYLTKEQYEAIESIVMGDDVKVSDNHTYEVLDDEEK